MDDELSSARTYQGKDHILSVTILILVTMWLNAIDLTIMSMSSLDFMLLAISVSRPLTFHSQGLLTRR